MFKILTKETLAPSIKRMRVHAPAVAKKAKAGQFIILRVSDDGERIPLTVADTDGDAVTIIPSKGPVLVQVPDVTLKKVNDATKILKDLGLEVKVSQIFGGVLKTVRFQDPAAGTMVRRGTVITLTVI